MLSCALLFLLTGPACMKNPPEALVTEKCDPVVREILDRQGLSPLSPYETLVLMECVELLAQGYANSGL